MATSRGPRLGRGTKLTPERHAFIVEALRAGAFYDTVAAAAHIDRTTLYDWLRRGRQPGAPPIYKNFYEDVMAARAEGEVDQITLLNEMARGGALVKEVERTDPRTGERIVERQYTPPDPKPIMFLLERGHPARWGRRASLEITATDAADALPTRAEDDTDHTALVGLAARIYQRVLEVRGELPASPHQGLGEVVEGEVVE